MSLARCVAIVVAVAGATYPLATQRDLSSVSASHPAIDYANRPVNDPIAQLNRRVGEGQVELKAGGPQGYLRSLLAALDIPVESQTLAFSETSLQSNLISLAKPRAIYFNDTVAVGWMQGADTVEVAAVDRKSHV